MENAISFEGIKTSNAKNLLKKICVITCGSEEKSNFLHDLNIEPKSYSGPYTKSEQALKTKIIQLEQDLLKTSHQRDMALEENRRRVDELKMSLISVKETLRKIIRVKSRKDKRIRMLEEKIDGTITVRSKVSGH